MVGRQAVLFRAHAFSSGTHRCLGRLVSELGPEFDVWVVGFCRDPEALARFCHARTCVYDQATLSRLPYPAKLAHVRWDRIVGHNDLPVLYFFRSHPEYARYWIVEYDVRYTGNWGDLLADCGRSDAGLLGTTLQRREENPDWANWRSVATGNEEVPSAHWIKGFLPFSAVTPTVLSSIDQRYSRGWTGHCEATWPMIASLENCGIEDIGGAGSFVRTGRQLRYYWNTPLDPHLRPGSFVFRPTFSPGQDDQAWTGREAAAVEWAAVQMLAPNRLVHPVKD
jgi:hypothetical protein